MSKICFITKKKSIIGNRRSNSMRSSKRKFFPNIHNKKIWIPSKNKYININISTKAIRIINKIGIEKILSKFNIRY